jgi:hypothetical protein
MGTSFLASIYISSYTCSVRPDRIAGVVDPRRIVDAGWIVRMEGRVVPLRAYDLALSLIIVGLGSVADGSERYGSYEGAGKGSIERRPFGV